MLAADAEPQELPGEYLSPPATGEREQLQAAIATETHGRYVDLYAT
jgi:hypothetical protein